VRLLASERLIAEHQLHRERIAAAQNISGAGKAFYLFLKAVLIVSAQTLYPATEGWFKSFLKRTL